MPASVKSADRPASSTVKPRLATKSMVLEGSPAGSSPRGRTVRETLGLRTRDFLTSAVGSVDCAGSPSGAVEAGGAGAGPLSAPSASAFLPLRYLRDVSIY
jgi:hypothetical protein